jgi:hypothetical protein
MPGQRFDEPPRKRDPVETGSAAANADQLPSRRSACAETKGLELAIAAQGRAKTASSLPAVEATPLAVVLAETVVLSVSPVCSLGSRFQQGRWSFSAYSRKIRRRQVVDVLRRQGEVDPFARGGKRSRSVPRMP